MRYFFFLLLLPIQLMALPVGNPAEAALFRKSAFFCTGCSPCECNYLWIDNWSIRLGFYGDYVFDRAMKRDPSNINQKSGYIHQFSMYTNAGYIALNLGERVDLFGTVGSSSLLVVMDEQEFLTGNFIGMNPFEQHYNAEFSWSAGARVTLCEYRCLGIGFEGQYFRTTPKMTFASLNSIITRDLAIETTYCEWQGAGGAYAFIPLCNRAVLFSPYAAIKLCWAELDMGNAAIPFIFQNNINGDEEFADVKDPKHLGYAVGITLVFKEMLGITAEVRLADEQALYINGQMRF